MTKSPYQVVVLRAIKRVSRCNAYRSDAINVLMQDLMVRDGLARKVRGKYYLTDAGKDYLRAYVLEEKGAQS